MSALDIDSMRALTAIAESGGITRAAKRLNLSQSAVSHKMKRLERKLNRSLFARADGKLNLSADGEKLLDYAQRLVKFFTRAILPASYASGLPRTSVPRGWRKSCRAFPPVFQMLHSPHAWPIPPSWYAGYAPVKSTWP
jgi:molybdate transport repressor ModE-like protein